MQRVSLRTLILMLELLVAVVAFQYRNMAHPAKADAVWLATESVALSSDSAGQVDDPLGP
jgi:hypothetical protein